MTKVAPSPHKHRHMLLPYNAGHGLKQIAPAQGDGTDANSCYKTSAHCRQMEGQWNNVTWNSRYPVFIADGFVSLYVSDAQSHCKQTWSDSGWQLYRESAHNTDQCTQAANWTHLPNTPGSIAIKYVSILLTPSTPHITVRPEVTWFDDAPADKNTTEPFYFLIQAAGMPLSGNEQPQPTFNAIHVGASANANTFTPNGSGELTTGPYGTAPWVPPVVGVLAGLLLLATLFMIISCLRKRKKIAKAHPNRSSATQPLALRTRDTSPTPATVASPVSIGQDSDYKSPIQPEGSQTQQADALRSIPPKSASNLAHYPSLTRDGAISVAEAEAAATAFREALRKAPTPSLSTSSLPVAFGNSDRRQSTISVLNSPQTPQTPIAP
ncbi:uncharacterized protein L969DRAFT_95582 [Mixia osmundae IAM 14324]|uniref:Transmembrane protein n=1 Tax=Mixia osmundae (strain CBS 9802 / IAM 14324 / JCM 22182 / KY 12970) TaxID=764103 RepID=G7E7U5_MIXOS|nr:uncharacterized protein L969DRAFT_95582 [Mixia osmundae IAM 14324]KEI38506.1 hypothetical protein L969DRAFT_95582 [Mixia osmundae IAM 14324]GAA98905.1 hypothetical protein E5Q_05593 [Mixia osmundae IAM 14324]